MKLSKENFEHLHIPNLLINIWEYNDESHNNHTDCCSCKQYEQRSIEVIEVAKSKWQDEFKIFTFAIALMRKQNKKFFDFGKVNSADRNIIYHKIWKQTH